MKASVFEPRLAKALCSQTQLKAAWPPSLLMDITSNRITSNHFALFGLPERYAIDAAALDAAYRELQAQVHPDKFASAGDAERRVALQWATRANEAYRTLRDPLKRAAYLCTLRGAELETESNTAMPRDFLMQQMEWREALDDARNARDLPALEALDADLRAAKKARLADAERLLDHANDAPAAAKMVRQLMFLERFGEDIAQTFELLEA